MKYILLFFTSSLYFLNIINAQPGTLDPTFGTEGKVVTHFDDSYLYCFAAALQSDGKIIAGGRLQKIDTSFNGFVLIRYNADGSIDKTFGDGGQVLTAFNHEEEVHAIAVKPNGQIIALGYGYKRNFNLPENYSGYDCDILLAAYHPDGSLDSSFGAGGKTVTDLGKDEVVGAMALQADGKIVATGLSKEGYQANPKLLTVRYTADGILDETFGKGGSVISASFDTEGAAIAVDAEGKIVVGGKTYFPDRFLVERYLPDGTIDASFGSKGVTVTSMDAGPVNVKSILVLKNGNILAAGVGSNNMMAVRYDKNGIIDNEFSKEGRAPIVFKEGSSHVESAFEQPDGKIILAGGVGGNNFYPLDFALASILPDGKTDMEFGDSGRIVTDFGQYETAFAALLQGDGKIVLAGHLLQYFSLPTLSDFALARYNTSQSAVLPLALTQFSAVQNERGVALNWQTATETNTNYFSVQRSIPNSVYTEIAKVKSIGYSTAPHNYTYIDNAPAAGANTYQLKVIDKDGKTTYSKAASVNYAIGKVLKLYPNPAHNTVTVEGLDAGATTTISLLDARGKTVKQQRSSGSAKSTVSIANLAAGTYYLKAENGTNTTTIKFVKE